MKSIKATRRHKEALLEVARGKPISDEMIADLRALGWVTLKGLTDAGQKIVEIGKAAQAEAKSRAST